MHAHANPNAITLADSQFTQATPCQKKELVISFTFHVGKIHVGKHYSDLNFTNSQLLEKKQQATCLRDVDDQCW